MGVPGSHVAQFCFFADALCCCLLTQARMKYLVEEWGVPKFRSVVEQYFGKKFEPFKCARGAHARD